MSRLIGVFFVSLLLSGYIHAETKIGYLDLQAAVQSTSAGKKAKKELEKDFKKKEKAFKKQEADLKKMRDDLEKKKLVLSEESRAKKEADLQQEFLKFQQAMAQSQLELQKREQVLTKPIMKKLEKAINQVAKKGGYTMVFEKSRQGVIWAQEGTDLTSQVVKTYEKMK